MDLETFNKHERDTRIFFDEEPHKYYIDGVCNNISVTTLIHEFGEKFDSDRIIKNMMRGKNWSNSQYFGMSVEEIKKKWKDNGEQAAKDGTYMHKCIEDYWNDKKVDNETLEYNMFLNFVEKNPNLKPYRTEWVVYHEEHKICGSIDGVFINEDGTLSLYDWKRSKEIVQQPKYKKYLKKPLNHLPDTNYWTYSLQLNMYKYILESKYDKTIKDMHVLCMHPNNEEYQLFEIKDLQKEIKDLIESRKE
tara:strand:- start:1408 stop:2151 length:744 start_codon:yes stop_codon:yes gene_type:complete